MDQSRLWALYLLEQQIFLPGNITTNTGTVTSNKTTSVSVTGTSELQGDVTITNKANIGILH